MKANARIIKNYKDYKKKFLKQFAILFFVVLFLTLVLGCIDHSTGWFKFESNDYYEEILITLIEFLGVLNGFIIVGLSIFVSGLQNRFASSSDAEFKKNLDEYWDYLIKVTKFPVLTPVLTIFFFIMCLTFRYNIEQSFIHVFALPFCVCLAGLVTYISIVILFDYFSNPFKE